MIIDGYTIFEPIAGGAITVTRASTNQLDLLAGRDLGVNPDMPIKVSIGVGATFTAAGAATMVVQIQGAPDNGSGAPGAYYTLAESRPYALADLVAGTKLLPLDLPAKASTDPQPRFLQLNYVVATGPMTAGTLNAQLTLDRSDIIYYNSGFTLAASA